MDDIRKLLEEAWTDGFKNGLHPGAIEDAFEKWFDTVDLKAWLIMGIENDKN